MSDLNENDRAWGREEGEKNSGEGTGPGKGSNMEVHGFCSVDR